MAPSSSLTDTAESVVSIVGKVANIALTLERGASPVAAALTPIITPFFPAYPAVLAAIAIADPIIAKIAAAAPAAGGLIEAGRPLIDLAQAKSPELLSHLKDLLAIAINHDPALPEDDLKGSDISDEEAHNFMPLVLLGRPWTAEEIQRWNDHAQGKDVTG